MDRKNLAKIALSLSSLALSRRIWRCQIRFVILKLLKHASLINIVPTGGCCYTVLLSVKDITHEGRYVMNQSLLNLWKYNIVNDMYWL